MPVFPSVPKSKLWLPLVLAGTGLLLILVLKLGIPPGSSEGPAVSHPESGLLERGEYEQAVTLLENRLASPGLTAEDQLEVFRSLGILYWISDRDAEAMDRSRRALELASSLGLTELAASLEAELALMEDYLRARDLRDEGNIRASDRIFEKARLGARAAGSKPHELKILRKWSLNHLGSRDSRETYLDLNLRALDLALSINLKREAFRAAQSVGSYHFMNNEHSRALSYYLRALSYVRDQPPANDTIACLNNISAVYMSLGDSAKAEDYLAEATRLFGDGESGAFRSSLSLNLGQTLLSLARRLQMPEYYDRALECFTSCLEIQRRVDGGTLGLNAGVGISGIYLDQGRLEEAGAILVPALEKARTLEDPRLTGAVLLNLGNLALKSAKPSQAEGYFEEVRALAGRESLVLLMMHAAYGLGRCAELSGRSDRAVDLYDEAVRIISEGGSRIVDETDRAEFISKYRRPFQAQMDLYFRLSGEGNSEAFGSEMFRVAENARARSFIDFMERQAAGPPGQGAGPGGGRETELNAERMSLLKALSGGVRSPEENENLRSRIRHLDDMLDAALSERYLQEGAGTVRAAPVSLKRLQNSVLTERTALIEYFLGRERSYAMCVTGNSFHVVGLPPAAAVSDSLAGYLAFLENPAVPTSIGTAAARRLYEELFAPIAGFIPGSVDHLVIVPDGVLFRLPFSTLVPGEGGDGSARILLDRYSISYAPSASSLFHLRNRPPASYAKDVLAFGVAAYPRSARRSGGSDLHTARSVLDDLYRRNGFVMGPIPYAEKEIRDLAGRARFGTRDVYSGAEATEEAFKGLDLEAYRHIHLACHAFSDDNYPFRSSLVLGAGRDDEEDGFLQVSEMLDKRTNADLVVLSACQTGKGKILVNEGMLGLPRFLFYMGARSVVSTMWPVHDRAGAILMSHFYDAYFGGLGKAEALRVAKRKMMETRYGHPHFWASFTLTGEYR